MAFKLQLVVAGRAAAGKLGRYMGSAESEAALGAAGGQIPPGGGVGRDGPEAGLVAMVTGEARRDA